MTFKRLVRTSVAALALAIFFGTIPAAIVLRQMEHNRLNTLLILAMDDRNPQDVIALLAQGADPNLQVEDAEPQHSGGSLRAVLAEWWSRLLGRQPHRPPGTPLLAWLLRPGHPVDWTYVTAHRYLPNPAVSKMVRVLLDHGADPNAKDAEGGTALLYASSGQDPTIVKQLLDSGALPNATGALDTARSVYNQLVVQDPKRCDRRVLTMERDIITMLEQHEAKP